MLSFARNDESHDMFYFIFQKHQPKTTVKIQGSENGWVCSSNVSNTLMNSFYAEFVNVIIKSGRICRPWHCFFGTQKIGELFKNFTFGQLPDVAICPQIVE